MFETFIYAGYIFLGINLSILLWKFSKHSRALKIFTVYTGGIFVIQMIVFYLKNISVHNLFLSHFYFLFQFIILSFFYLELLKNERQRMFVKVGLCCGLFSISVQYLVDNDLFWQFNLFEIFVTSFLLTIYATFHFYNQLDEKKELYFINAGILMYLFASTVLFLVGNLVAKLSSESNSITWFFNAVLYFVYQLLILIELRKRYLSA